MYHVTFCLPVLGSICSMLTRMHYTFFSFYEFWARTIPSMLAPRFGARGGSGSAPSNAVYSQLGKPDTMDDDEELGREAKELDDDSIYPMCFIERVCCGRCVCCAFEKCFQL